jgi:hypothetical protein
VKQKQDGSLSPALALPLLLSLHAHIHLLPHSLLCWFSRCWLVLVGGVLLIEFFPVGSYGPPLWAWGAVGARRLLSPSRVGFSLRFQESQGFQRSYIFKVQDLSASSSLFSERCLLSSSIFSSLHFSPHTFVSEPCSPCLLRRHTFWFHVNPVKYRHLCFVVSSMAIGFAVTDLKRVIMPHFDVYFHLWRDGGETWIKELRKWQAEEDAS